MEFETSSTLISTATKTLPPSWMTDFPQATSFIKKRRHELDGSFNPRSNSDDGLSISFDINTVLDSALSVMTTTFTTMGNTKCDTSYRKSCIAFLKGLITKCWSVLSYRNMLYRCQWLYRLLYSVKENPLNFNKPNTNIGRSSCSARTTCIPYHESQRSCNEDSEGCIFW